MRAVRIFCLVTMASWVPPSFAANTETESAPVENAQIDETSEGAPTAPTPAEPSKPAGEALGQIQLKPYVSIVGGLEVETIQHRTDLADDREDRIVTLALSRFGLRGTLGEGVYVESELEVNAGPHGTSVWEGQAALQVRNQMVRVTDMRSANGTHVNGQRLGPGEVRVLRHGDRLRLGKLEMAVTILHAATSIEM